MSEQISNEELLKQITLHTLDLVLNLANSVDALSKKVNKVNDNIQHLMNLSKSNLAASIINALAIISKVYMKQYPQKDTSALQDLLRESAGYLATPIIDPQEGFDLITRWFSALESFEKGTSIAR
jgi:hypothetical protein